jgi:hypothetical protein
MINEYIAPYNRSQFLSWQALFGPSDSTSVSEIGSRKTFQIYRSHVLTKSLRDIVHTYYTVKNVSVEYYEYLYSRGSQTIEQPQLTITTFKQGDYIFDSSTNFNGETSVETYKLSEGNYGPFTRLHRADLKKYIYSLVEMDLDVSLKNYALRLGRKYCYIWNINVHYDFQDRGRIEMTVNPTATLCQSELDQPWYQRQNVAEIILYACIFFFAVLSQILHLKAIYKSVTLYQSAKKMLKTRAPSLKWRDLPFSKKMKFFNIWFFIASIGNICNMVGPVLSIKNEVYGSSVTIWRMAMVGLGCMMAWITMVQYFEHSGSYYVLILTLKKGTPRVLRFVVGILPIFVGYAIFGVAIFSPYSDYFASMDDASVTLFALLNGDDIHNIFEELSSFFPVLSRIYLYTFISLFIYAVLNIFIAIVEDAFFASKAFSMKPANQFDLIDLLDGPPVEGEGLEVEEELKNDIKETDSPERNPSNSRRSPLLRRSEKALKEILAQRPSKMEKTAEDFQSELFESIKKEVEMIEMAITASFSYYQKESASQRLELLQRESNEFGEDEISSKKKLFRPPHDKLFYPCGYTDCIYCEMRKVCDSAFLKLEQDVENLVKKFNSESEI